MTRSYDRDAKHYDRTVLNHLVETGQGQYYPAQGGIYVIKTEEGTVAVRPHQIIEITTSLVIQPVAVEAASPMDGYHGQEQYDGEDIGPHGVVFQGLLDIAEKFLALDGNPTNIDPLVIVRRALDDETGGYLALIKNETAGIPIPPCDQSRRGFLTEAQEDNLLGKFL